MKIYLLLFLLSACVYKTVMPHDKFVNQKSVDLTPDVPKMKTVGFFDWMNFSLVTGFKETENATNMIKPGEKGLKGVDLLFYNMDKRTASNSVLYTIYSANEVQKNLIGKDVISGSNIEGNIYSQSITYW